MAKILLAVVLVLIAASALPDLARLRDFGWLKRWIENWNSKPAGDGSCGRSNTPVILIPLILIAACAIVQGILDGHLLGLASFAFALVVLYYCWGPRDLEADIESVIKAPDSDRRLAAAQNLRPPSADQALPLRAPELVEATFLSALSRWFGVLFWFALLGPVGALGYRLVQLLGRARAFRDELGADDRALFARAADIADWAPAHLMALALALVSNFDAVMRVWHGYHASHGRSYFTLDCGYLGEIARASVRADLTADQVDEISVDDPLIALTDARTLLRRVLITWLAVLGVLVLAGWVH